MNQVNHDIYQAPFLYLVHHFNQVNLINLMHQAHQLHRVHIGHTGENRVKQEKELSKTQGSHGLGKNKKVVWLLDLYL